MLKICKDLFNKFDFYSCLDKNLEILLRLIISTKNAVYYNIVILTFV